MSHEKPLESPAGQDYSVVIRGFPRVGYPTQARQEQMETFKDDYDASLLFIASDDGKAYSRQELKRVPISRRLGAIFDQLLGDKLDSRWFGRNSIIRIALYHGLHHLGTLAHNPEAWFKAASVLKAELEADATIAYLEAKQRTLEKFHDAERNAVTKHDVRRVINSIYGIADHEDDEEHKAKLLLVVDRLKARL